MSDLQEVKEFVKEVDRLRKVRKAQEQECKEQFERYSIERKASPLTPKDEALFQLMRLAFEDERRGSARSPYIENEEKTRAIGETLNKLGGFQAMLWAQERVPLTDQRELEICWDGIGEWEG